MRKLLLSLLPVVALIPSQVQAVIFYDTGDASYHTTAPTGSGQAALWDSQGSWLGGFLGTPISSNQFISAAHIGGGIGDTITFAAGTPNAGTYTVTAVHSSGSSDLRIFEVSGTFNSWVPLVTATPTTGSDYIVFGRGTQRGNVYSFEGTDRGWTWGAGDQVMRWGTGTLGGTTSGGQYVYDTFSGLGSITLSSGDSGGALFVNDGGIWKLAGINYAVTGPYKETLNGTAFNAALYDQDGLYVGNAEVNGNGAFFSTSIAAESAWIASVIPEPSVNALLIGALAFGLAFRLSRTKRA